MARKVVNRKELRAEADAAEAQEATKTKKAAKKATTKKATKRKSRAKEPVQERMKLLWGVFSQSLKQVAAFEYDQKDEATKRAEELSASGKSPHFVKKVKSPIEEA